MNERNSERNPVEMLAEQFLERYRRGERPALSEYTKEHPDLAEQIRDLFPALVMMEGVRPGAGEATTTCGPGVSVGMAGKPERLGDYRILREIGRGGMGIVYEAEQESLGRHVALKVLPTASTLDPQRLSRFQREARAAARLHHTNIVPVFGVGEDRGVLYYAMQFIQGQALDVVLQVVKRVRRPASNSPSSALTRQGFNSEAAARSLLTGHHAMDRVPVEPSMSAGVSTEGGFDTSSDLGSQPEWTYYRSIARLGVQAAEGLAHAHAQGILHRDIKPSNLLLDAQGTLWITDFGLAKAEGSDDLTHTGEFVGTLRYMAPERFAGKGDARSDVYALGVTLYEMLTLRPPFTGQDRVALMSQITQETPPPPSKHAAHLPRDLETIVQKAMAREPAIRYATARELADDLRRFLENRPIRARRSSAPERLWRWCRRNPAVASLVSAVFTLLVCLAVGSTITAYRLDLDRQALEKADANSAEKLYQSLVAQANASRFSHRVGQRFDTLDAVSQAAQLVRERHMPAKRLSELRNLAIAAMALPDLHTIRTWEGFPEGSTAWAVDGRHHLYGRVNRAGLISVRAVDTDEEIAQIRWRRRVVWLGFAATGKFLAAADDQSHFRIWKLSLAEPQFVLKGVQHGLKFAPDGRHLLVISAHDSARLYDLQAPIHTEARPWRLPVDTSWLEFDPTGNRLAIIHSGQAEIRDVHTGVVLFRFPVSEQVERPAWHPSGHYLALVCANQQIHVWDLKRHARLSVLEGCRNRYIRVVFSPEGDYLLSQGWENMLRVWQWRTGRQLLQQQTVVDGLPHFEPAGRFIARSGGSHLTLVQFASAREYRAFVPESREGRDVDLWGVAVHPDGRLVAVTDADRTHLFDLFAGEELASLPSSGFTVLFQDRNTLVTNGPDGLLRWPIRRDESDPSYVRVGPPQLLNAGTFDEIACTGHGALLGQAAGYGAFLLRPGKPIQFLGPHAGCQYIALSPDGKYAATGNQHGSAGVRIWDTNTGRLLTRIPMGGSCSGLFSPDGQFLALRGQRGHHIYRVGTWEEASGQLAESFSPDGSMLVASSGGAQSLRNVATGYEVARLENPSQDPSGRAIFTRDGAKLVCSSALGRAIQVWDLRAIREQLATAYLDWNAPAYSPQKAENKSPLHVTVDLGQIGISPRMSIAFCTTRLALNPFHPDAYFGRGKAYGRLHESKLAIADYSMALALMPASDRRRGEALLRRSGNYHYLHDDARSEADLLQIAAADLPLPVYERYVAADRLNAVAWQRVAGPLKQRDPAKAIILARAAVNLTPNDRLVVNTLGVAYYRHGEYKRALATLEVNLRQSSEAATAFDYFILAMCHAKLGLAARAREDFAQALQWIQTSQADIDEQPHWNAELEAFRKEAEAVLRAEKS